MVIQKLVRNRFVAFVSPLVIALSPVITTLVAVSALSTAHAGEANGEGGAAGGGTGADASGGNSGAPGVGGGSEPGGSNGGSTGSNGGVGGANGAAGYGGFGGLADGGQSYGFGVASPIGQQAIQETMFIGLSGASSPGGPRGTVVTIDVMTGKVVSRIGSSSPAIDAATMHDAMVESGTGGKISIGIVEK